MTVLGNRGHILLIEDSDDDVELTMRALDRNNIANEVVRAKDGAEALLKLGEGSVEQDGPILPALVLLDLKLPKIDGLEVLRRVRADPRLKRLPIVILTSSNEQRDLLRGYDLGANGYVRKPVDFQQFADAIRTLGLYWLVLNEPPPAGVA